MFQGKSILAVIPARLESARLPRKLLLDQTGKPVIQHTWEAAKSISTLDDVVIATDSEEIASVARQFGGTAIITGAHRTGTDRIAEAVTSSDFDSTRFDLIVNIQGDEPEITSEPVNAVICGLIDDPDAGLSTAVTRFHSLDELHDPGCVKVVGTTSGRALYFSRSVIPCLKYHRETIDDLDTLPVRRHIGLYGFRRSFLQQWPNLPQSSLERIESLEQLRPLQAGIPIHITEVSSHPPGIDLLHDYEAFVERAAITRD